MEHFLESLKKLKKPSVHSNPEDVDPLFCRYNKGWNDAIEKVEKLINSFHSEQCGMENILQTVSKN